MKPPTRWLNLGSAFFAISALAQAHPGHDGHELTWDFSAGFAHPFTGWDHVIAMIAMGWWAAQLSGRARWLIPAAFLGMIGLGVELGRIGCVVPGIEQAVAASVFALGLLVAATKRIPTAIGATAASAFALFHGLAHGAGSASGQFGGLLGFCCAAALLLGVGAVLGKLANRLPAVSAIIGAGIASFGVLLLVR